MQVDKITYLYLKFGRGYATVAIKTNEDNTIEFGASFCSPEDKFNKNIGRKLAAERLNGKKDFYIHFENTKDKITSQVRDILYFIVLDKWVSVIDFEKLLNVIIYDIITEKSEDIGSEVGLITMYTKTNPIWAKHALIERNIY